jgi:signal transduction histidine kinase
LYHQLFDLVLETNKAPLLDIDGKVIGILGTYQNVTARKEAEVKLHEMNQQLQQQAIALNATVTQLEQSQIELVKREKASALGNLVAGIAHEINNPIGFLGGNLKPAQDYTQDLFELIEQYQTQFPDPGPAITATIDAIDLDYLRTDLPKLLGSMQEGINRIKDISTSLRTFSRSDTQTKVPFRISEGIDSTVMILRHRLKGNSQRPEIEIITDYGDVPNVICFPGQLNQVFMNLLANAIDALEEGNANRSFADIKANPNQVTIRTRQVGEQVHITIGDNGIGMTPEIQQQVFGHQFTTKAVGHGTGLGLTISHQIVVEKHGGTLQLNSELGQGTTFTIAIPIDDAELA